MKFSAFSYREDPSVPAFDDSAPLVIFDGLCVLCSAGVEWMMTRDPKGTTRFAVIQDLVPRALYAHYGLDADRFDTFMVLTNGKPYIRWAGLLAAARAMPGAWRLLGRVGRIVPSFLGDRLYDFVQKNRLAWFGKREGCFVPDAATRARFL